MAEGFALDYDGTIKNDSSFVLLKEGKCSFVIDQCERARHEGSEKIPPCAKMIVHFRLMDADGNEAVVKENYIMWSTLEWKLSELFMSVGLKKKGEEIKMEWDRLPGLRGECEVFHDPDKKDPTKVYNRIKKLLPKEGGPKAWTAGKF